MKRRLLLLLCLLLTAGGAALANIGQGTCKNGSWVIDNSGKLTVNINGDMEHYKEGKAPWYQYSDQIKAIHIGSQCTRIGRNAFYNLRWVVSVTGGENVEGVHMFAFEKCGNGIPSIYFPKCNYVGECAFSDCTARAISLPLVETWKEASISGGWDSYSYNGLSRYRQADGISFCDMVDLGSKVKTLKPGSVVGPSWVFISNPTPPKWSRLYDVDTGIDVFSHIAAGIMDVVTYGAQGFLSNIDDYYSREYPFGDNPNVKVIVPENLKQTYIDYYKGNGMEKYTDVAEGFMCGCFTDPDDHSQEAKNESTGRICSGAPIYDNGKLIGGWYVTGSGDYKFLYIYFSSMPSYQGKTTPWASVGDVYEIHLEVGDGKIPAGAFKGNSLNMARNLCLDTPANELAIGDNAFEGNTRLTSLTSITNEYNEYKDKYVTVGNSAFKNCTNLRTFKFEIADLGTSAFEGCANLGPSIKFNGVQVPDYAFKGCKNLDKIEMPKASRICEQAFMNTGLDDVNLVGIITVEKEAFSGSTFSKLTFGPSTQGGSFGSKCFANCSRMSDIFVSYELQGELPQDIFSGLTLSKITLHCKPDLYGKSYEDDALFGQMKVDRDFTFPVEGSIIGASSGTTWTLSSGGTLRVTGYDLPDYDSNKKQPWYQYRDYIKDIVLENNTRIGKNNFSELPKLKNVSIPRTCKRICDNAFAGCASLENIYITRVETLGNNVFEGCTSLKSIELGASLKEVGDYVFKDCHSLDDIENINSTPATTTKLSFASIKSGTYDSRRRAADASGQGTVNLSVPDAYVTKYMLDENWSQFHISYADERGTWKKVGQFGDGMWILYDDGTMLISADRGPNFTSDIASNLGFRKPYNNPETPYLATKKIEFAGNLTEVPWGCFDDFPNLESVKLSPSIKKIGESAFSRSAKLRSINLENVDTIGQYAFSETGLDILDLSNVKKIDRQAFGSCKNLVAVTLGANSTLESSVFSNCTKLTVVNLNGANIDNANNCFRYCNGLKIVAYNGTHLPDFIFSDCKELQKVSLGSRLESIEWSAFENCTRLDTIVIDRPTPPALPKGEKQVWLGDVDYRMDDAWAFDGLTLQNIHLVVPPDYIAAYKKANIWKDMTIEGDVDEVEPALPMGGSLQGNGKAIDGMAADAGATWYLDEDGTLTIEAEGGIAALDKDGKPWSETFNPLVSLIKHVVVAGEVTSLPHNFFGGNFFDETSAGVETVTLGESLETVGDNTLSFSGIKDVYIYSLKTLGLYTTTFNQDAAVKNDATLHVLKDAVYDSYRIYYAGSGATKRFPHIVADLVGTDPRVQGVSFAKTELTLYIGQSIDLNDLNPQFIPENVKVKTLRYDNLLFSNHVTIDENGIMTGVSEGPAYIEAWSDYTADGGSVQALWGSEPNVSTYLKVTVKEDPGPAPIFFDVFAGTGTEAPWVTYHVLRDEHIDADTNIKTCEVAGYFDEDDVTTQAIPEWMTGSVNILEEAEGFEVIRIGAYSLYERNIRTLYLPWTVTQIGHNACARCYMLGDVYIPSYKPLEFTDDFGDAMEPDMGHNDAFYRVGEDVDGATLHVPEGSKAAWDIYPWNEWFRRIVEDAPLPDGINSVPAQPGLSANAGGWFDLSGRKLDGKPAKAGLYILNGKKVVIK